MFVSRHLPPRFANCLTGCLAVVLLTFSPALLAAQPTTAKPSPGWSFEVSFSPDAFNEPFSGRVYVILTRTDREPRLGPNWFRPEVFASRDVVKLVPGQSIVLAADSSDTLVFPDSARKQDLTGYTAQAVIRFNRWERNVGTGPGNGFSQPVAVAGQQETRFLVDQLVPQQSFTETAAVKLFEVPSQLLTDFYSHPTSLRATVTLPESYDASPQRRYPVIFMIPGFGGTHVPRRRNAIQEDNPGGVEFIRVQLDPSCRLGHHVFANSANNGPVGDALVREFLPALDKQFRTVAAPTARFLTGHSSGGWSTLWLQVTYRKHFGGTWSTSPDPVCFDDFQRINLYRPGENMYVDRDGKRRPLARARGQVLIWYDDFSRMEWVLGHGGQLHSFEAVLSPRDDQGQPRLLWNRQTGEVDTTVAEAWKKYDIRRLLRNNWTEWQPDLAGKIHVHMGDVDTFYLEGATILLKQTLEQLEADAVVEIHPGKDHSNILTPDLMSRIRREMARQFLKHHPAPVAAAP